MQLTYDLDKEAFVKYPGSRWALTEIALKRGDVRTIQVRFIRNLETANLPDGTTFKFGAKAKGQPTGAYMIYAAPEDWSGPGDGGLYQFTADLTLDALKTLLEDNDHEPITLDAELERTVGDEVISSATISIKVSDDINRGSEVAPEPGAVRRGIVDIPDGDSSVTITFDTPLGSAPTIIDPDVRKPSSSAANLYASVDDSTVTANGFTVHLSAAAPGSGYKLQYRAEE